MNFSIQIILACFIKNNPLRGLGGHLRSGLIKVGIIIF